MSRNVGRCYNLCCVKCQKWHVLIYTAQEAVNYEQKRDNFINVAGYLLRLYIIYSNVTPTETCRQIFVKFQIENFVNILPVTATLFVADEQVERR